MVEKTYTMIRVLAKTEQPTTTRAEDPTDATTSMTAPTIATTAPTPCVIAFARMSPSPFCSSTAQHRPIELCTDWISVPLEIRRNGTDCCASATVRISTQRSFVSNVSALGNNGRGFTSERGFANERVADPSI